MKIVPLSTTLLGALFLAACGGHETDNAARGPAQASPLSVRAETIASTEAVLDRSLTGTVRPIHRATLSARTSGQVTDADFQIGTVVETGDELIRLSAPELDAQVEAAEAALAQVERDLDRESALLEKNATTREAVRNLENAQRQAAARLEEARSFRDYTTVTAPFDGVVTRKLIEVGDIAQPGTPLLALEGTREFEVQVDVPEGLSQPDQGASFEVTDGRESIRASLSAISPSLHPASRSRSVLLALPADQPFQSRQFVRVQWPQERGSMLSIPSGALRRQGQMEQVFVIENDVARMRLIRTGVDLGERLQVQSGLSSGERVVLDPPSALVEPGGDPTVNAQTEQRGVAGRFASYFIDSKLTPIMVIASILLGLFAVWSLPREEEPQIKVPMVDISLGLPFWRSSIA